MVAAKRANVRRIFTDRQKVLTISRYLTGLRHDFRKRDLVLPDMERQGFFQKRDSCVNAFQYLFRWKLLPNSSYKTTNAFGCSSSS
jgi:hypothetical protein